MQSGPENALPDDQATYDGKTPRVTGAARHAPDQIDQPYSSVFSQLHTGQSPQGNNRNPIFPIKRHRSLVLSLVNVGVFSCILTGTTADRFSIGQMTIEILPDEALLEIFSFYLVETSERIEPWLPLVHVCLRW